MHSWSVSVMDATLPLCSGTAQSVILLRSHLACAWTGYFMPTRSLHYHQTCLQTKGPWSHCEWRSAADACTGCCAAVWSSWCCSAAQRMQQQSQASHASACVTSSFKDTLHEAARRCWEFANILFCYVCTHHRDVYTQALSAHIRERDNLLYYTLKTKCTIFDNLNISYHVSLFLSVIKKIISLYTYTCL